MSAADEPERGVRGLEWTLHELVAHLAGRSGRFAAYLSGTVMPEGEIAGIVEENRRDVGERQGRPVADLVEELRSNVSSFVATTHGKLGADPFPWYSGVKLDVATASGLLLAELAVHGFDAARTLGRPWPIASADARTIIRASATLAPWYVDPDATRGDRTTYRIVVRGGPAFRLRIDDGTASIEPPRATRTARSGRTPPRWSCCRTVGSTTFGRRPRAGYWRPDAAPGARYGSTAPSSRRDPSHIAPVSGSGRAV